MTKQHDRGRQQSERMAAALTDLVDVVASDSRIHGVTVDIDGDNVTLVQRFDRQAFIRPRATLKADDILEPNGDGADVVARTRIGDFTRNTQTRNIGNTR